MIAGHAYALGASLATLNPKDFELIRDLVPIVVPERRV
jgi:predicted nucleic acid-binding protein